MRIGIVVEGPAEDIVIPAVLRKIVGQSKDIEIIPTDYGNVRGTTAFTNAASTDVEHVRDLVMNLLSQDLTEDEREEEIFRQISRLKVKWGNYRKLIIGLLVEGVDLIVVLRDNDGIEENPLRPPEKTWGNLAFNLPFDSDYCFRVIDANHTYPASLPIVDADLQQVGETHKARFVESGSQQFTGVVIGVPVQMLDTWLLAVPEAFETILFMPFTERELARCNMPEEIHHPKGEIIAKRIGRDDISAKQAKEIVAHTCFEMNPIREKCPSFARFEIDVRACLNNGVVQ